MIFASIPAFAIGILIAVCSILAGWLIGCEYGCRRERMVWKTRCRLGLQVIENLKEQISDAD